MAVTSWIAAVLATCFTLALLLRLPRLIQRRGNLWLWLTHLCMGLVLWLAVDPVYMAVDDWLGSANITNLISHIGINFVFLTGGTQIALGLNDQGLLASKLQRISRVALPICIALMIGLFWTLDFNTSSMGLNEFRDDSSLVVLYKLAMYIYPAFVSACLVRPLLEAASASIYRIHYWSKRLIALGFGLVIASPFGHLAEFSNRQLGWITDLFVYPAIALALVGTTLGYVSAWRLKWQKVS